MYAPTTTEEERIGKLVVDAAYAVHRTLGPGLLERIYEVCFCHELMKRGLTFGRQVVVPIVYDGLTFDEGLRLDVLVEELVICELKAVETLLPVHDTKAQRPKGSTDFFSEANSLPTFLVSWCLGGKATEIIP